MDSKEKVFNRFYDLLCSRFGGSIKMHDRFWELCEEAGSRNKYTHFSRLNKRELMILIEALGKPAATPGRQTTDQLLDQAEYKEEDNYV